MYLYTWQNYLGRTCFGITTDLVRRQNNYEGSCGDTVNFINVWEGPDRALRELENEIKNAFREYTWIGARDWTYEWINPEISYDQLYGWIEHEVKDIKSIIKIK